MNLSKLIFKKLYEISGQMAYFTSLCHLYNLSYDGNSLKLIFGEKLKFHVKIIFQNQTADYQNFYEKKKKGTQ